MSKTTLRGRTVDVGHLSPADEAAWRAMLQATHPGGNAFLSAAFAKAAAGSFHRVTACFIEDSAGVRAIFPYQFPSAFAESMGAAVRVGEELNDYFGLIAQPGFRTTPAELLRLSGLNYFYFTHLHQEQEHLGLSGSARHAGRRIMLPAGGDAYWAALEAHNSKFTSDTKRRERQAVQRLGELRFDFQTADIAPALETLLEHKNAQYARTGNAGWLAPPGRTELIRALSGTTDPDCTGTLSTLSFGDTWAAMHFGLRSAGTLHYWFPVYNPALSSYAPGRLLLRQIILNAAIHGIRIIDRGVGESDAKQDFQSEQQFFYTGAWHRSTLRGFGYRAYQSARWRLASAKAAHPVGKPVPPTMN